MHVLQVQITEQDIVDLQAGQVVSCFCQLGLEQLHLRLVHADGPHGTKQPLISISSITTPNEILQTGHRLQQRQYDQWLQSQDGTGYESTSVKGDNHVGTMHAGASRTATV